ncbi:unnamed protein product [Ilex paraguariensis]|uniref:CAP-Gly domain-containing protein n=1 Tax=Ilex paraguariensis TaxID=185542 RepID=A0ABC8V0L2_9AQUA
MQGFSGSETAKSYSVEFRIGQRIHSVGDTRRIGTVKYIGPVEGYSGTWVGIDWDNEDGKHDGSINGVFYFQAKSSKSASFVRPHNLSSGISLLKALEIRYRTTSTKEEEDEMYVLSASNKRVAVQLLGKDKIQDKLSRFEELTSVSLSYLGVSCSGVSGQISMYVPVAIKFGLLLNHKCRADLKELDLTGNLLSDWKSMNHLTARRVEFRIESKRFRVERFENQRSLGLRIMGRSCKAFFDILILGNVEIRNSRGIFYISKKSSNGRLNCLMIPRGSAGWGWIRLGEVILENSMRYRDYNVYLEASRNRAMMETKNGGAFTAKKRELWKSSELREIEGSFWRISKGNP